jgi:hypothetical protein
MKVGGRDGIMFHSRQPLRARKGPRRLMRSPSRHAGFVACQSGLGRALGSQVRRCHYAQAQFDLIESEPGLLSFHHWSIT